MPVDDKEGEGPRHEGDLARIRLVVDHQPPVVLHVGSDGDQVWVSELVDSVLDSGSEAPVGLRLPALVHPDDAGDLEHFERSLPNEGTATARFRCADRSYRWMAAQSTGVDVAIDGRTGTLVTLADLQALVDERQRRVESETLLGLVLENSGDALVLSRQGVVEWCTSSVEDLCGGAQSEWIGLPLGDHVHPSDRSAVEAAVTEDLDHPHRVRARFGHGDTFHWAEGRIRPFRGDDVENGRVLSSWRIIDDQVALEESLRGSESENREIAAQLRHALESRVVIEQAKGMIAGERGITIDEAFQVLRTHARGRGLRLHDVASAVVQLGLRL